MPLLESVPQFSNEIRVHPVTNPVGACWSVLSPFQHQWPIPIGIPTHTDPVPSQISFIVSDAFPRPMRPFAFW
jgi:hypothetical protein